ncbi:glucose-1-phosphate adenylyltransferase [Thiospirochaeta perfilievii]|uniref:Glucose-1-phosphate adenylyltransferase n=1 Tax=Thiospirochaeta perfilievii TaxID=252967 RepID=A0A5C1QFA5_9SPIO|nr:glucose-1-phosphate adenylyltransferase [Thiospirochaeta perfilievii]QEN06201.1 glucose-1-phosphate adenylyltransferase [Thiospirochaeta perfilievii]
MSNEVVSIVLGGGKGTRLYPLTKERSKPAVPFGGKYRLVDIPISNCINSNFRKIYILTQFNSASLHMHLNSTYQFDSFTKGFVEILAAEQTFSHSDWYNGTADAVRKNLAHFKTQNAKYYMILSGDQLYRMDLKAFLNEHIKSGADISIASTPVNRHDANDLGILKLSNDGTIKDFEEKPGFEKNIDHLKAPQELLSESAINEEKNYIASMGIYIFNADAMHKALDNDFTDFGKEVIPTSIKELKVNSYIYYGYWEDIGTIKSFYDANINLASPFPQFNLYDEEYQIYTRRRDLAPSKLNSCTISNSLSTDGSIISNAFISNSIIGIRTLIETGASLEGVYCMGADSYETMEQKQENEKNNIPNIGIGAGTVIKKAIIDANARIGSGCRIGVDSLDRGDQEHENYFIKDGIIVIPKNAIIPNGTCI